ncbi:MAG: hypothetical protein C0622_14325 [Desulfuromonas sp.]|nr:MAG: hypothetical protein C0622_14325 [Desulfuromonas sp.]
MSDGQKWEELCRRCGECCFEKKIDAKGVIHTTAVPCRFLDIHSRSCRVYEQRLQLEEDCIQLTPENIAGLDWLPQGCGYRRLLTE